MGLEGARITQSYIQERESGIPRHFSTFRDLHGDRDPPRRPCFCPKRGARAGCHGQSGIRLGYPCHGNRRAGFQGHRHIEGKPPRIGPDVCGLRFQVVDGGHLARVGRFRRRLRPGPAEVEVAAAREHGGGEQRTERGPAVPLEVPWGKPRWGRCAGATVRTRVPSPGSTGPTPLTARALRRAGRPRARRPPLDAWRRPARNGPSRAACRTPRRTDP